MAIRWGYRSYHPQSRTAGTGHRGHQIATVSSRNRVNSTYYIESSICVRYVLMYIICKQTIISQKKWDRWRAPTCRPFKNYTLPRLEWIFYMLYIWTMRIVCRNRIWLTNRQWYQTHGIIWSRSDQNSGRLKLRPRTNYYDRMIWCNYTRRG